MAEVRCKPQVELKQGSRMVWTALLPLVLGIVHEVVEVG